MLYKKEKIFDANLASHFKKNALTALFNGAICE